MLEQSKGRWLAWAFLPSPHFGRARTAEMALTGDRVTAPTALEWGLVDYVVEPEELVEKATGRAITVFVEKRPGQYRGA